MRLEDLKVIDWNKEGNVRKKLLKQIGRITKWVRISAMNLENISSTDMFIELAYKIERMLSHQIILARTEIKLLLH